MSSILSRRDFVGRALTAGTIAGLGDFAFLSRLRPVSADEAKPSKNMVQLTPEIEPLVEMANPLAEPALLLKRKALCWMSNGLDALLLDAKIPPTLF